MVLKKYVEGLGDILAQMDALGEDCAESAAEELDDLNAEFEDLLMMLGDLKPVEEDWQEEAVGILEDLQALTEDYRSLTGSVQGLAPLLERLNMAASAAMAELEE